MESEASYLIKKYLVGNPAVKSIILKGTGPSGAFIRGSLESKYHGRGEDCRECGEAIEAHLPVADMDSLMACRSIERVTFDNVLFFSWGNFNCCSCRKFDRGKFILHSVKQLVLNDAAGVDWVKPGGRKVSIGYPELRINYLLDQWSCLERLTIGCSGTGLWLEVRF